MRLILTLTLLLAVLLALVGTGYADTLTVQVDRDNGSTQITDKLVLNPANLGALNAADFKVKNLLSAPYNIKNDGTDQGAAINTILAAAVDGDAFYLPAGTYGHSVPIVLPDKMVKVYGDGPHATFLKALAAMPRSLYRAASASVIYRCELSDFGILGEKLSNYGVEIQAWKQPKINRIYVEDVLVEGMLLGQNGVSGSANMFYEADISNVEVYQKTGAGWLPDPSLRVDKGLHLLNTASDNDISHVVVAYAKTAGFQDDSFGNNRYSHIHPWGTSTYPMQYGILVAARVSISQGEFDTNATAGVKLTSNYGLVSVTGSQFSGTPTGVILQDNTPDVSIVGNSYDSTCTTPYLIYGTQTKGANFLFVDRGIGIIPGLASNTTGTAAGLSATLATTSGGTGSTDFAYNTATHNRMASFAASPGTGQCVQTDGSGNLTTTGSACGTSTSGGITGLTGDVTASGTGSVAATVIAGSTTQAGKVQLTDSTSSTSTTTAATPNSVKTAYDLANGIVTAKGAVSGYASLNSSSLVVQNPASGAVFAGPNNIPILDANGGLNLYWGNKSLGVTVTNAGSNATAYYPYFKVVNYANGTAGTPYLALRNSGGNPTTDAASPSAQNLGDYRWFGRGATADKLAANINASAESQYTDADQPTSLKFAVGGTGTNGVPVVKMTLDSSGKLAVTGEISAKTFTGTIPTATTYGATTTIDLAAGDSPSVTLTGNPTLAFNNPKAGQWHRLNLIQDGTGSRTVTWPSTGLVCTWRNTASHAAPTLLTSASSVDTIIIHTLSTTSAECWTAGNK